ncbi:hypothetical protein BHM03_00049921 [Ensete ventricosum]|nr:hypothetical protein BHM03_00049921 [Ensete ventricosum]
MESVRRSWRPSTRRRGGTRAQPTDEREIGGTSWVGRAEAIRCYTARYCISTVHVTGSRGSSHGVGFTLVGLRVSGSKAG